jgi:hypothetical protein
MFLLKDEELLEVERIIQTIYQKKLKVDTVLEDLFLLIQAIIVLHKIMNPLIFTSPEYLNKRFTEEEKLRLHDINTKFEDMRYFI